MRKQLMFFLGFVAGAAAFSLVAPITRSNRASAVTSFLSSTTAEGAADDYEDSEIDASLVILNRAAESKDEDPEEVLDALENLEKLMRSKSRQDPETANEMLKYINGSWRLIFTTGTQKVQERFGRKINYFPVKAIQTFDTNTDPYEISNAIYLFDDFCLIKFMGTFDFNLKTRKLEFDFNSVSLFGFWNIPLRPGEAASIGASSGLGSENNVERANRGQRPFFNWISADETIATSRGGGGGVALWKRHQE